jgi:predicted helicase
MAKGYIYVRTHPSYEIKNACKLGKSSNIPERDAQYVTGEITRGIFELVFEVPLENMGTIECLLQNEFHDLHIHYNAGTEFFHKKIISLIDPLLSSTGIQFRKLSKEEIDSLTAKPKLTTLCSPSHFISTYIPRKDQADIIDKSVVYFKKNDKGILVLTCGVGKTLISLWISQDLNCNTLLIGVPNVLLLKQWKKLLFLIPIMVVSSGVDVNIIMQFIEKHKRRCVVITTYSSAHKVLEATQLQSFTFSMKILDEVHHLTSSNMQLECTTKTFVEMLHISSKKQLSLTATLKQIEGTCNEIGGVVVSNDNKEFFGEIIDHKCLLWAIHNQIVCDYAIQTIVSNEDQLAEQWRRFGIVGENDKRLFLSAFASLKSIFDGHSHHCLIYSNSREHSLHLVKYIKMLMDETYFDLPDLYYSHYHSDMQIRNQMDIIGRFGKSRIGIITCVYCLGEGWDFPILDGVVFAENMSSNIRIVQSALRAIRKNTGDVNKMAKIILPILNRDDWLDNDNPDLKKVREVIYQMGLEDETISLKIKVFQMNVEKQKTKQVREHTENEEFGEYDEELTTRLRLKTVQRTALNISYNKARKIIAEKCPRIYNKEDYYAVCEKDNRLSKDPELVFKGQFTNWIDYLVIERNYYDLATCRKKVSEAPTIKTLLDISGICYELCLQDPMFPPFGLWIDYYNVKDLQEIIHIAIKKKKGGIH